MVSNEGGGTGERNTTEIGEFSVYLFFLWVDKKDLFKSKDRDNFFKPKQACVWLLAIWMGGNRLPFRM